MEEIGLTNIPNVYSQMDQWNSVMFLYDSALKAIRTKIEILNAGQHCKKAEAGRAGGNH